ncbi:MAG TPA: DUF1080 domain-containing protein, partial [Tepidisphaeraceae bacterium]|nr:DUF1080 domain-containing protein [Tepidisphaeraceae bacterium]
MQRFSIVASLTIALSAAVSCATSPANQPTALFDGATLNGWIADPPYATTLSGGDITDVTSLVQKLSNKSDAVSAYIASHLDDAGTSAISNFDPADDPKPVLSALSKSLNKIINGQSIYDVARFQTVTLRPQTGQLLLTNPSGLALARLNRMLLEDAYPDEIAKSPLQAWIVKDGAIASTGSGRGTLYTAADYGNYRILFTMRHVSGKPDHQACVLIFCTRPPPGEKGLDALGGIQFQVPNGGHWDYRKGHNNGGKGEYTNPVKPKFDVHQWSRVEILVNATNGTARMAVAQPLGSKAVEVLDFNVPAAGKVGPFALQMHNAG